METKAEKKLNIELENQVAPIERVDISSITPDTFFEKYRKPGTPVIITGLLKNEGDWDLDYLCEKFGNQELIFRNPGRAREKEEKRKWKSIGSGVNLQSMPFTEYAEMLRNHQAHENDINLGKCPLKNTPLADTPSLKDIGNRLGLTKPASEMNIYVAPGGHSSGLHYDSVDGTLMQLHGAKKVIFFPPSDTYNLYPFPVYIHLRHGLKLRSWFSQVDLENPDFKTMPKFKEALQHKREVILEQGETLYIPAGWWHEVIGLGDEMVCAVNRFWRIYPTSRAVFSWSRWRAACGMIFALPYTFLNLAIALGSRNRKQKISKISHRM
ncbi:cupin-like domain-containing protein [Coleofasciculus sp. FACHB-1120]|uniref:cupin-like domain-containing protein n=1 Tax=Coleofasciculus sp. FACHB-1120 TaxID=2692783 RepID=UPI0016858F8E|nr:cupin-like domain-containing protein [Coleofasciculus sp. FACHB-1120]MBD2740143.1 cupin-like domain-containing protein [Coleofasciculus sp. FACHB-1120]